MRRFPDLSRSNPSCPSLSRSTPSRSILSCLVLSSLFLLPAALSAAPVLHPLLARIAQGGGGDPSQALPVSLRPAAEGSESGASRFGVWIRTRDGGASLEGRGLLPPGENREIRRARWSRNELRSALSDPSILSVMPAVRCAALLDSSLFETAAAATHEGSGSPPVYSGLTGRDVIVGIVDTGIDLEHGDFLDAEGNTRILSLWDQTVASADPPRFFSYGKEWTADQIDAGLAASDDPDGHGTHVAGIAAGDGSATGNDQPPYRFVGVAPEASVVFVKTDFLTTSIADGVSYIFQKADSLGWPAVVNLSLGTHYGPHDGTEYFDLDMAALAGPGRSIVAAAGNENGDRIHAERRLAGPGSTAVTFSVPVYSANPGAETDEVDIDCWYTGGTALAVRVVTPNGHSVGPAAKGGASAADTPDGRVEIDNNMTGEWNGDENLHIRVYDRLAGSPPAPGTWTIEIESTSPTGVPIEFDAWIYWWSMPLGVPFQIGSEESELVASPASGDSVIAVGAYVTKSSWIAEDGNRYGYSAPVESGAIAYFSSVGPRRDGALKPDLCAPGRGVAAALSAASEVDSRFVTEDGKHVVYQGTSMAAPHVAGLAALVYQNLGPMSVAALRDRLRLTARSDAHTGAALPDSVWGYGKMDALGATGYVVPILLAEADARQIGDRVHLRFLLSEDAGAAPFLVCRQDPGTEERVPLGFSSSGRERTFVDSTLSSDGDYAYWLRSWDGERTIWLGPASVRFRWGPPPSITASPNPFAGSTEIRLRGLTGRQEIEIYDLAGRRVQTLRIDDAASRGVVWDGRGPGGIKLASGVYFMRHRGPGGETVERRLIRLR